MAGIPQMQSLMQAKSSAFSGISNHDVDLKDSSLKDRDSVVDILHTKIRSLELLLAEKSSQYNDEIIESHAQIAKLRASFEKNEVLRQQLEFELTVAQKATNQEVRKSIELRETFQNELGKLQAQLSSASQAIQKLEMELLSKDRELAHEKQIVMSTLGSRENLIYELRVELENVYSEKATVEERLQDTRHELDEMRSKCLSLEGQRGDHIETITKLTNNAQLFAEQRDESQCQVQKLQSRVASLEDAVEAERAAHLETKFATEVLQLKVRDLDRAFKDESGRLAECRSNFEAINKDFRQLLSTHEASEKECGRLRGLLERGNADFAAEKSALQRELEHKSQILDDVKNELDSYHGNLEALRSDIAKKAVRLAALETDRATMRKELEMLSKEFHVFSDANEVVDDSDFDAQSCDWDGYLRMLRQALTKFKGESQEACLKLSSVESDLAGVKKEASIRNEILTAQEQALKEAERLVQNSHRDLLRSETKCARLDEAARLREREVSSLRDLLAAKEADVNSASEQASALNREVQTTRKQLTVILNQIASSSVANPSSPTASTREILQLISDRVHVIRAEAKGVSDQLKPLQDELARVKESSSTMRKQNEELQVLHQEALERQRVEFEEYYGSKIDELQDRLQKSEAFSEEAYQKSTYVSDALEKLQVQSAKMRSYAALVQGEKLALATSCTILAGLLWGLVTSRSTCVNEKQILMARLKSLSSFKDDVALLSKTLQSEMALPDGNMRNGRLANDEDFKNGCGILRFRVAVVAVLAANRFFHLGLSSQRMAIRSKFADQMCCGGTRDAVPSFKGVSWRKPSAESGPGFLGYGSFLWLAQCPNADNFVRVVAPLMKLAKKCSSSGAKKAKGGKHGGEFPTVAWLESVGKCTSDLVSLLEPEFRHCSRMVDAQSSSYGGKSLAGCLSNGLEKALKRAAASRTKQSYVTSAKLISTMHEAVLQFTQRLHNAEVERRTLRVESARALEQRDSALSEMERLRTTVMETQMDEQKLRDQICDLELQMDGMVPEEQFREACADLNAALKREEELKKLFKEQAEQIFHMNDRIERHAAQGKEKSADLEESVRTLVKMRAELKRLEQSVADLQASLLSTSEERDRRDATISSLNREREVLASYLQAVSHSLQESKRLVRMSWPDSAGMEFALPELILPDELLAMEGIHPSAEVLTCQNTVKAFLEAQKDALLQIQSMRSDKAILNSKIKSLQEDVGAYRLHVERLKNEISAVCEQDLADTKNKLGFSSTTRRLVAEREFHPIQAVKRGSDPTS